MAQSIGPRLYSCCNCRNHYPGPTEVVQTRDRSEHGRCQGVTMWLTGRTGRAFLFSHAMNIVLGAKEDRNLLTGLTPWLTYLVLTATNRWVGSTREPTRPRKSTRKASSFSKKLRLSRRRIGSERIHYWI
ncbi:hypothetical protein YC2023_032184 [Brassica napus]